MDVHNGAVSAVAAVVIASFTVVLVVVSRTQARLTREALIKTERAFVFVEDFVTDWSFAVQERRLDRFLIKPRWKNNGTTPTRNMTIAVNWTHWMGDLPPAFEYKYGEARTRMFLAPQATEWSAPIVVPPHVATQAFRGDGHIFVWGRVDYADIFDHTKPHFTQWCYRVIFNRDGPGMTDPGYVAFGEYNNSDEEGGRQDPWYRRLNHILSSK